jgi:hypothetical protein
MVTKILTVAIKSSEATVYASYTLSQSTAERSKPSTDGELVKEHLLNTLPRKKQLFKTLSLSATQ